MRKNEQTVKKGVAEMHQGRATGGSGGTYLCPGTAERWKVDGGGLDEIIGKAKSKIT